MWWFDPDFHGLNEGMSWGLGGGVIRYEKASGYYSEDSLDGQSARRRWLSIFDCCYCYCCCCGVVVVLWLFARRLLLEGKISTGLFQKLSSTGSACFAFSFLATGVRGKRVVQTIYIFVCAQKGSGRRLSETVASAPYVLCTKDPIDLQNTRGETVASLFASQIEPKTDSTKRDVDDI